MLKTAKEKIQHFITFKVLNHTLTGIGNLMTPFSKVSNKPILSKEEFEWSKLLEDNWEAIRNEAAAVLIHDDKLPNIEDIQPQEQALNIQ